MKKLIFFKILLFGCIFEQNAFSKIVNPLDLLSPHKFSVMAKYIYAKQLELGIESTWGEEIYHNHLKVWNNCEGDPGKNNIDEYIKSFKETLASLKTKGFDPCISTIPVGYVTLVDGEHRFAGSLLYNIPLHITESTHSGIAVTSYYFKEHELATKYLDAMALQYAQLKTNSRICIVCTPLSQNQNNFMQNLKKCSVVYEKSLKLNHQELENLIALYFTSPNASFANLLMQKNKPLYSISIYLLDTTNTDLKEVEQEINKFNTKNTFIYIAPRSDNSLELSQLFFNENSITNLKAITPKELTKIEPLLIKLKEWIEDNQYDKNLLCILENYYSLDNQTIIKFIYYNKQYTMKLSKNHTLQITIDTQNNLSKNTLNEIVYNPEYHYYVKGVKFAASQALDLL